MSARPICPHCDEPGFRVYSQVMDPTTRRSTSVALPAVFCGTPGYDGKSGKGGHGTLTVGKGQHGLVPLGKGTHAAAMRASRTAVALQLRKGVVRKGGVPTSKKGKAAKKATPKKVAHKPARASKPAPKAKDKGRSKRAPVEKRAADVLGSE